MTKLNKLTLERQELNRGQVLIATAGLIAFTVLSLTLVMNSALFADNLEAQGIADEADLAEEYQSVAYRDGGRLMYRINSQEPGPNVEQTVRDEFIRAGDLLFAQKADSQSLLIEYQDTNVRPGIAIKQSDTQTFTDSDGNANWEVADTNDVRRFRLNVDTSNLPNPDSESQGDLRSNFHIRVDGSNGETWRLYIYDDGGTVGVATQQNNETIETYNHDSSSAIIGATTGTIAGDKQFDFAPNVDAPYAIAFQNGGTGEGRYTLTVTQGGANRAALNVASGNSPYYTDAAYSISTDLVLQSQDFTSTIPVTVAPCEPRADSCLVGNGVITDGSSTNNAGSGGSPSIQSFDATRDTTGPGRDTIDVSYSVEDNQGDLDSVKVELINTKNGNVADSQTHTVSGSSGSGSMSFNVNKNQNYDVVLTVTDKAGNTTKDKKENV